jgi:hypothetical protein
MRRVLGLPTSSCTRKNIWKLILLIFPAYAANEERRAYLETRLSQKEIRENYNIYATPTESLMVKFLTSNFIK